MSRSKGKSTGPAAGGHHPFLPDDDSVFFPSTVQPHHHHQHPQRSMVLDHTSSSEKPRGSRRGNSSSVSQQRAQPTAAAFSPSGVRKRLREEGDEGTPQGGGLLGPSPQPKLPSGGGDGRGREAARPVFDRHGVAPVAVAKTGTTMKAPPPPAFATPATTMIPRNQRGDAPGVVAPILPAEPFVTPAAALVAARRALRPPPTPQGPPPLPGEEGSIDETALCVALALGDETLGELAVVIPDSPEDIIGTFDPLANEPLTVTQPQVASSQYRCASTSPPPAFSLGSVSAARPEPTTAGSDAAVAAPPKMSAKEWCSQMSDFFKFIDKRPLLVEIGAEGGVDALSTTKLPTAVATR